MKKIFFFVFLFYFSEFQIFAQVPLSEKNALISLYDKTNGHGWKMNNNWKTTQPVNTWYGVTTEIIGGVEHVTKINLKDNNMHGFIPPEIGNLTSLAELSLPENRLFGAIPSQIGNLTNLVRLSIYDNELAGSIPNQLSNLTSLEYLAVSMNKISGELPDLSTLTSLKTIYINDNNFHFADFESQYTSLQNICQSNGGAFYYSPMNKVDNELTIDVKIGNNYTLAISPVRGSNITYQWYKNDEIIIGATSSIYEIISMEESDLGDYTCKVTSSLVTDLTIKRHAIHLYGTINIGDKTALLALFNATDGYNWKNNSGWNTSMPVHEWYGIQVRGNRVVGIDLDFNETNGYLPVELGNLTELETLIITNKNKLFSERALTGTIPIELGNLSNLKVLGLDNNLLEGSIPPELGNLSQLIWLSLANNQLAGNIPVEIGNLSQLEYLFLNNNNLTGAVPTQMQNITGLKYIILSFNQLTGAIPDLSSLTQLIRMHINSNNFHFGDFESQFSSLQSVCYNNEGLFIYAPMYEIGAEQTIDGVIGSNYTLTMSPVRGTNVSYQWYRNGEEISGAILDTYEVNNAQQSDFADYTCEARSSIVNDLIIKRRTIHLYGMVNSSDKAALLALYNATDGPNWTNHTNWNTTQKVHTWFGVKMRGNRVTELRLKKNNLNGSIPVEIGNLQELKVLELSNNNPYVGGNLSGDVPQEITNLIKLKDLSLWFNNLSGVLPTNLNNCPDLEVIQLWGNHFTGNIPSQYGGITHLKYLILSGNELSGSIPTNLSNCTELNGMFLSYNQLSGDVPDIFSSMPNLYYLNLDYNTLTGNVDMSENHKLFDFRINSNNIQAVDIRTGNNTQMLNRVVNVKSNDNLTCVYVDDALYSTQNWTNIDSHTHFVETEVECAGGSYQLTYVPDDNFENYLETHDALGNIVNIGDDSSMGNGVSNDNFVFTNHINHVSELDVSNKEIADLTGIEDFTYLDRLNCYNNSISSLSLDKNILLNYLYCSNNNLVALNLDKNKALQYLYCSENDLVSLNLNENTSLISLSCQSNNLTSLNIDRLNNLVSLRCYFNDLTMLNLEENTSLRYLRCYDNDLSSLNVDNNANLEDLYCHNNEIDNLNLNNNTALQVLYCKNNNLTTLNIENNINLLKVHCAYNDITDLNVINNTNLRELRCQSNDITSLDLSQSTQLNRLWVNNNALTSVNLQNGNNSLLTGTYTYGSQTYPKVNFLDNPNLTCIFVDDAAYSTSNWTSIDAASHFVETQTECDAIGNICYSYGNTQYQTSTTRVNFNTIDNATGKDVDSQNNAYSDFTTLSTDVHRDSSYEISVSVNTDGSYTTHTKVWIDWDQNNVFDESNEAYDLGTANSTANGLTSISPLTIIIPSTALLGNTKMRVSTKYSSAATPCEQGFDGEVEDYTLNVLDVSSNEMLTNENFQFYPNPTKNTLHLSANQSISNIIIYDVLGQEVLNLSPNKKQLEVNTTTLNRGVYIIKVTIDDKTASYNFIKN